MASFVINAPNSLAFGVGEVRSIGQHCQKLDMSKILIVTDPGIIKIGLHKALVESLKQAGLAHHIFSDVCADPPTAVVDKALKYAQDKAIDGIVGLGGGSSLDVAKLIAVLKDSDQSRADIYGIDQVKGRRLPLIQVPTTAGTGSEVTPISIITTGETTKAGIVSSSLLPDLALLDPELTTGLPPHVTAATGIDAMVHAIEAYTSKIKKNPYSDMLAKQALIMLAGNIKQAVMDGANITARSEMLLGATLAGQAFANAPVAAVHALAYPLGGHFHIPHGLSNSLVLSHVMRFNAPIAAELYAELATIIVPAESLYGDTASDVTESLIRYLDSLTADLNLPTTLKDMGIKEDDLPMLASAAMEQQRLLVNNPREVKLEDALEIYQSAYQ